MSEANYTALAPTCACGNEITKRFKSGKSGKYCNTCMARQCGKLPAERGEVACKGCGKIFEQVHERGPIRTYCSSDCRRAIWRAQYVPKGERPFSCAHCTAEFTADRKRKYCSKSCSAQAEIVNVRRKRQASNKQRGPITCRQCGVLFSLLPSARGTVAYCDPCMRVRDESVYSVMRRNRIRDAQVEHVDRIKVFERDKWRCQVCGVKTVREPYKPRSAELDHIVPLAQGGEHSYRNVQCACRRCNSTKGATAIGQLRLI